MRKLVVSLTFVSLLLAACGGAAATDLDAQAAQIAALEGRIAALEAQLSAQPAETTEAHDEATASPAFDVVVAQYLIDTAGFHAIDESLNETKTIEASYLSTVNRVNKVVAQTPWPEELHERAEAFGEALEALAAALDADDAEQAATLATELHTVQHDFSHAIDGWLGTGEDHGHGN